MIGISRVHGESVAFHLDPTRSNLEMRGTINAFGLNLALKAQGAGSLIPRFSGPIVASLTSSNIHFQGTSQLQPAVTGHWEPGPFGVAGTAPANYGMLVGADLGTLTVLGKAAGRDWQFDVTSPELPLQAGSFTSRHLRVPFVAGTNSVLDYYFYFRLVPGGSDIVGAPQNPGESSEPGGPTSSANEIIVTAAGRHIMSGMLTNRATAPATLTLENGLRTLTLPMDARYSFIVTNANNQFRFDLLFVGQLIATEAGRLEYWPPTHPGGPIRLSWPIGYRLQRALRDSPTNWSDAGAETPLELQPQQPAEYFRAVKSH